MLGYVYLGAYGLGAIPTGVAGADTEQVVAVVLGGGDRARKRRRRVERLEPMRVATRTTTVDDTLYRQMFPDKEKAKAPEPVHEDSGVPVALLMAWMAGFDDDHL